MEIARPYPKQEEHADEPDLTLCCVQTGGGELLPGVFRVYGLETGCLRYFNVFGPRQDPTSQYAAVIPRFIAAVLDGRRPVIYGDGRQSRDFTTSTT